jgi:hypothetical protein
MQPSRKADVPRLLAVLLSPQEERKLNVPAKPNSV